VRRSDPLFEIFGRSLNENEAERLIERSDNCPRAMKIFEHETGFTREKCDAARRVTRRAKRRSFDKKSSEKILARMLAGLPIVREN